MIEYIKLFWESAPEENHRSSSMKWIPKMSGWSSAPSTSLQMDAPAISPDLYEGAIEITPIPTVEELNAHIWGEVPFPKEKGEFGGLVGALFFGKRREYLGREEDSIQALLTALWSGKTA